MSRRDQKYYDAVALELRDKILNSGLWARAIAEMHGDGSKARALYIRLRVDEMREEEDRLFTGPYSMKRFTYILVHALAFIAIFYINTNLYPDAGVLVGITALVFTLITAAMRLRNIGNQASIACWLLVPLFNVVIAGELYAKPQGYEKTRNKDFSMYVILILYYSLLTMAVFLEIKK